MNKVKKTIGFIILLVVFICGLCGQCFVKGNEREKTIVQADSYQQSSDALINPDRGFYKSVAIVLTGEETGETLVSASSLKDSLSQIEGCSLLHLRFDLAAFSSNAQYKVNSVIYVGTTKEIPALTLQAIGKTFEEIRKINATAIVRFSYNQSGLQDENGYLNAEPDTSSAIPIIKKHISQLGKTMSDYQDVISGVETGMIGPWGEQHSTTLAKITNANTLYYNLIEAWLSCGLDGVNFSVRRPLYYRYWANEKYSLNLTDSNMSISETAKEANPDLSRVGIFNDAYLGSSSDMGTYTNRETETLWLNTAAQTVLFGGEVVADTKTGGIGAYNNAAYAIYESRIVHTSYLNRNWNERVIGSQNGNDQEDSWETIAYSSLKDELSDLGEAYDSLYANKTAYDYIADHMGYRLVLKSSSVYMQNEKIQMKFSLENVGFGNVVKEQRAQILFVKSGVIKAYVPIDLDVREIKAGQTKNYETELSVPSSLIKAETYEIYLKLGSAFDTTLSEGVGTNLRTIAFANEYVYDSDLGANKLCLFTVEEKKSTVEYCDGATLTSSDEGRLMVATAADGVSTVTVVSNEAIGAHVDKALTGHTAQAYPYIIIDYECDVDYVLSVYYDSGSNCISYKQTLPAGRHTVVYQTTNNINTLRLYVTHGQTDMADTEIKFYNVQLASHCVLEQNSAEVLCYMDDSGTAYPTGEILSVSSVQIFTPCSIKIWMTGAEIRLSGDEETSGICFGTLLDKADYDALVKTFGEENVTVGVLILPTSYLNEIAQLSIEALEKLCEAKGVGLADLKNVGWNEELSTSNQYGYYGSLVSIYKENFNREFTAIGYITVENQGNVFTVFADYENNSRSIRYIAQQIILDVATYEELSSVNQALLAKYAQ